MIPDTPLKVGDRFKLTKVCQELLREPVGFVYTVTGIWDEHPVTGGPRFNRARGDVGARYFTECIKIKKPTVIIGD